MPLRGDDPNSDPVNLRIVSLPQMGTLYQVQNEKRGPAINAPLTPVSDPGGQVIFAPIPGEFGDPYTSFTFIANDGDLDSKPATVTISIAPMALPIVALQIVRGGHNLDQPLLSFIGGSPDTYRVWVSTSDSWLSTA